MSTRSIQKIHDYSIIAEDTVDGRELENRSFPGVFEYFYGDIREFQREEYSSERINLSQDRDEAKKEAFADTSQIEEDWLRKKAQTDIKAELEFSVTGDSNKTTKTLYDVKPRSDFAYYAAHHPSVVFLSPTKSTGDNKTHVIREARPYTSESYKNYTPEIDKKSTDYKFIERLLADEEDVEDPPNEKFTFIPETHAMASFIRPGGINDKMAEGSPYSSPIPENMSVTDQVDGRVTLIRNFDDWLFQGGLTEAEKRELGHTQGSVEGLGLMVSFDIEDEIFTESVGRSGQKNAYFGDLEVLGYTRPGNREGFMTYERPAFENIVSNQGFGTEKISSFADESRSFVEDSNIMFQDHIVGVDRECWRGNWINSRSI